MVSEKQIEAAADQISEGLGAFLRKFCDSEASKRARHYLHEMPKDEWNQMALMLATEALTAAELSGDTQEKQAEPAILPDDSLSAIISNIGNEIHNLACERQNDEDLSERLSDFRTRLWAIAQQAAIEPAPAARSGAVKGRKELIQKYAAPINADVPDRVMRRHLSEFLDEALAALEPAEAALAEAERENEALRKHLQVAAGRLQWSANTTTDNQKSSLLNDWADEARNAGGKDAE